MLVGDGNSIIDANEVNTFTFTNSSFNGVRSSTSTDNSNLMVNIQTFNLTNSTNSTIQDISVESSSIGFLQFNKISGSLTEPLSIKFSGIEFKD